MNIRNRLRTFKKEIEPQWKESKFTLHQIRKSPLSVIGIIIIVAFAIIAILAPTIAPPVGRDPFMVWKDGYFLTPQPPGSPVTRNTIAIRIGWTTHIFGTTGGEVGQVDIYYGCIWGTITAFRIGITVTVISLILGVAVGLIAGYYGGAVDELMMRFTDIIFAFPGLILAMALVMTMPPTLAIDAFFWIILAIAFIAFTIIGGRILKVSSGISLLLGVAGSAIIGVIYIYALNSPSLWTQIFPLNNLDKSLIALTIVGWPGDARLIRSEVLRVKQEDYIEAAKVSGCSDLRIILRHILPNAMYPILITASLGLGGIVLTAAALSFLGIGSPLGYADWGQMISFARSYVNIGMTYWWTFFIPGIFIFLFVLGWNLLGDAFRDILDPTLRRR
jgi:peptide/nickel transport system permease protein